MSMNGISGGLYVEVPDRPVLAFVKGRKELHYVQVQKERI